MTLFARIFLVVGGSILISSCGTVSETRVKDTTRTFTTVVVDAGHGGKDNGAFRRFGGAEKNATLDVATRLAAKLRESQFHVVMTRSSDLFIPLDERAAISNGQKNAIFVSVHFNDNGGCATLFRRFLGAAQKHKERWRDFSAQRHNHDVALLNDLARAGSFRDA